MEYMNKVKGLFVVGVTIFTLVALMGCQSSASRAEDLNTMGMNEVERLPEAQKDTELNKTLAEMRKYRTDSYKVENGMSYMAAIVDSVIPGQTKNRPSFEDEGEEIWEVIYNYVENEAKIPKRSYGHDVAQCIDPRMNALYDDEDKGVAAGYENENIFLAEYETEEDDVYSYLVLVRDDKSDPWEVIHDGTSYKE